MRTWPRSASLCGSRRAKRPAFSYVVFVSAFTGLSSTSLLHLCIYLCKPFSIAPFGHDQRPLVLSFSGDRMPARRAPAWPRMPAGRGRAQVGRFHVRCSRGCCSAMGFVGIRSGRGWRCIYFPRWNAWHRVPACLRASATTPHFIEIRSLFPKIVVHRFGLRT